MLSLSTLAVVTTAASGVLTAVAVAFEKKAQREPIKVVAFFVCMSLVLWCLAVFTVFHVQAMCLYMRLRQMWPGLLWP